MSGQPFDFPLIRTRIFIYQFSHQFFCVTFLHREQISERAVNFYACAEFVYNFSTFFLYSHVTDMATVLLLALDKHMKSTNYSSIASNKTSRCF